MTDDSLDDVNKDKSVGKIQAYIVDEILSKEFLRVWNDAIDEAMLAALSIKDVDAAIEVCRAIRKLKK